jgi:cytochrome c biogenesis protein CcdA
MSRKIIILLSLIAALIVAVILLRSGGTVTAMLWAWSDGGKWLLPLIVTSAILDSINPCAFSVLLLTIAFLFSIGKLRSRILLLGGSYIVGLFLVYLLIGLGILGTLHLFSTPHFMARIGAILLIVLGSINVINEIWPSFPLKLKIPHVAHRRMAVLMDQASAPTALLLGGLVGICEFPCTGGPYLTALGLLHDQTTYLLGFGYLILYNLIFILPLVTILLLASDRGLLAKVETWQKSERGVMRFGGGVAMIVLGVIILWL